MRVERIIKNIKTLGPGNRLVIWTNGCNRRCKGCVSENLQEIEESTEVDIIQSLNEFILCDVDGITISGGEPFIQIKELRKVIEYFIEYGIYDILIYTGYTFEELVSKKDKDIDYILENIAVLVDGEYIEELNNDSSNIIGSTNQRVLFLKNEYTDLYKQYIKSEREVETFYIGNLKIGVGIPTSNYIKKF